MSGWYGKAERKEIPPGGNDPRIDRMRGVILHVDAGNTRDLYDYFDGPSGGVESHFQIAKDGHIFQYRSTTHEADANWHGNSWIGNDGQRHGYISVETQGLEHGEWTKAQMRAIKALLKWASEEHGFPLRVTPGPRSSGVGHHTLFGAPGPWTPVSKSCPGPKRKEQFHGELTEWFAEQRPPESNDAVPDEGDREQGGTYTVRPGDTLADIAQWYGTEVEYIVRRNDIEDPDVIFVGQVLHIPTGKGYQGDVPGKRKWEPEPLRRGVRPGRRNGQVRKLQRALLDAGYGPIRGAVTTFYGPQTQAAVARFHDENPRFRVRPHDVEIGPLGWAHLQREARS